MGCGTERHYDLITFLRNCFRGEELNYKVVECGCSYNYSWRLRLHRAQATKPLMSMLYYSSIICSLEY